MRVNETFLSVQGEGYWAGRWALFVRFAGCNLWSGLEHERGRALCTFCDTDFRAGQHMTDAEIVSTIETSGATMVVYTGGEPCLQLTPRLIKSVAALGCYQAIETNGTIPVPAGLDWICVSPKAGAHLKQVWGNEIKVVWPQDFVLTDLRKLDFDHFYVQPDYHSLGALTDCLEIVRGGAWRLSIQTHKLIGVP